MTEEKRPNERDKKSLHDLKVDPIPRPETIEELKAEDKLREEKAKQLLEESRR